MSDGDLPRKVLCFTLAKGKLTGLCAKYSRWWKASCEWPHLYPSRAEHAGVNKRERRLCETLLQLFLAKKDTFTSYYIPQQFGGCWSTSLHRVTTVKLQKGVEKIRGGLCKPSAWKPLLNRNKRKKKHLKIEMKPNLLSEDKREGLPAWHLMWGIYMCVCVLEGWLLQYLKDSRTPRGLWEDWCRAHW